MCGIVGLISTSKTGLSFAAEKAFNQLLVVDELRGPDSTGIFSVTNIGEVDVLKENTAPDWFMANKLYDKVMQKAYREGKFLVGHNRKATIGKIEDATAHPFSFGKPDEALVLVHNGTLSSYKHLYQAAKTDSEAIAYTLHADLQEKPDKPLKDILGKFSGAYCLIFYDQRSETFTMLRNSQRPMWVAFTKNDGIFFGSEGPMLSWILDRNNIKIDKLEELPPHEAWSMGLDDNDFTKTECFPSNFHLPPTKASPGMVVHNNGENSTGTQQPKNSTRMTTLNTGSTTVINGTKALKHFRRNWVNKVVNFFVEDYVEDALEPYQIIPEQYTCFGQSLEIPHDHILSCKVPPQTMSKIANNGLWAYGRIDSIEKNNANGVLEISLTEVKTDVHPNPVAH